MNTLYITAPDGVTTSFEVEDANVYSQIAKSLSEARTQGKYDIVYSTYSACFQLINKGGTFFIRQEFSNIPYVDNATLPTVYLVMVNPEYNNYKFYQLEDAGDQVLATYGRIGATSNEMFGERTHYYPKNMYYVKLMEKLAKGYKDMTDVYITKDEQKQNCPVVSEEKPTKPKNTASITLYNLLLKYAKHAVQESCISSKVTNAMITATSELLQQLYAIDVGDINDPEVAVHVTEEFNQILLQLLCYSPRRVSNVEDLLATSPSDFAEILAREDSLLQAMRVLPGQDTYVKNDFERYKIKVHYATDKQKEEVLRHLSDNLKAKVKNVYRVIHPEHKARFNQYLEKNNIKKVKQLWHGSRNQNWLSIIDNGLLLNPNAIITGKMFGQGIYFAPSSQKSWGYTSAYNSYWARGSSDTCFMGLYAVAYGKPLNVSAPHSYTQKSLKEQNANCVHAHAGSYLKNDEIIFYDESAILLNYIVEFSA